METIYSFQACSSYLESQIEHNLRRIKEGSETPRFALTLSRQTGTRGHAIAELLSLWLKHHQGAPECAWAVFDRNLIEKALQDSALPARLARFMPEDHFPELESIVGEILNLHPSHWELFQSTSKTIVRLATLGNVILMGRGANVLTAHLPYVAHARLIGSFERRVEQVAHDRGLSGRAAEEIVREEDRARRRYFKTYFSRDIDDPFLYDLFLKTDDLTDAAVVEILGALLLQKSHRAAHPPTAPQGRTGTFPG